MPDKQDRYRKRKSEQGLKRVEVLIPHDTAPLLKAYARALRDAHALGLEAPLFNGMEGRSDHRMAGAEPTPETQKLRANETEGTARTRFKATEANTGPKRKKSAPDKMRPDFSKGLLDE